MDSINREQPEDNYQALAGKAAVVRIGEVLEKTKTCFFCTAVATGASGATRPMNVRECDNDGNLWFLSASDSHKNREIESDPTVRLFFQGSEHSDFMQLTGRATVLRDTAKIRALWEPLLKTWFTGGVEDPRITVIKVEPSGGYYWDNKHGNAVAGIKMMIGAALGKTLDDSIEGTLKL